MVCLRTGGDRDGVLELGVAQERERESFRKVRPVSIFVLGVY